MRLRVGLLRSTASFSPAVLFAAGEVGAWYDPSDLTTLFQDTAGSTPVTTPGQTVALMLDKSRGLTPGPELVTNGTFDTDTMGWALAGGTASVDSSGVTLTNTTTRTTLSQSFSTITGRTYVIAGVVNNLTSGVTSATIRVTSTNSFGGTLVAAFNSATTGNVPFVLTFTATANTLYLWAANNAVTPGLTVRFDNLSVRELPGNHATQATTLSRPTYAIEPMTGRRNLLTFTEQFDNSVWAKTSLTVSSTSNPQEWYLANDGVNATSILTYSISPSGTAIFAIDIKADTIRYIRLRYGNVTNPNLVNVDAQTGASDGTAGVDVGGGFYRFVLPFVSGADNIGIVNITLSDTFGGTTVTPSAAKRVIVRRPQFELGSTATAYQRVTTQFDVTEAGVASKSYLFFDGSDDFMLTGTITPSTDKAQVFAGVRKLRDSQPGILVEFSATVTANPGSFYISAPESSSASDRYAFAARGTQALDPGQLSKANIGTAPDTAVITGTGDISGDSNIIRRNSVAFAAATTDQGTGNYLAYPLYIGRRGGTMIPFNGNIYGLIVRFSAANMDAATIGSTETWMNQRTGAY